MPIQFKNYTGTLTSGNQWLRWEAGVNPNDPHRTKIVSIKKGSTVTGVLLVPDNYGSSYQWLLVTSVNGKPAPGYLATTHLTVKEVPGTDLDNLNINAVVPIALDIDGHQYEGVAQVHLLKK